MSKEIQALATAGSTVYAQIVRASDGKIWNTSGTPAFEAYATANIANYAITMTQAGSASGLYTGDFPTAITVGRYNVTARIRAGGSPAESDFVAAAGELLWSGTAVAGLTDSDVAAIKAKTDNLPSDPADASDVAAAFTTVNNTLAAVASYVGTETAAIYNRIGLPVNGSIAADIVSVQADTDNIQTRIPAALVSGRIDASVGAMATNTLTASALATDAVTEIQTGLATPTNITAASGVALAATGLDSIPTTPAAGVPATFREMFVWVYRRFAKKFTRDTSDNTGKAYADNGTSVLTTQSLAISGTVQTQGPAT